MKHLCLPPEWGSYKKISINRSSLSWEPRYQ